jgi:lipoate-protein ligase A
MTWRFIIDPPLSPAMNMAIDSAMAAVFVEDKMLPTLRLYQWKTPAITLGAFQKSDPSLNHFLETHPVKPVRRITGGQAFLHDLDFTYSIVASTHDPLFSGGIKKTFYAIAEGLLAGLSHLRISANIHSPARNAASLRDRSPFCADSISWYEIAVDGKKLIGSAQKRWPNHFLQHGSMRLKQSVFEKELHAKPKMLNLYDLIGRVPPCDEIENAMQIGFETAWGIKLAKGSLTDEETALANRLMAEKYNIKSAIAF